MKFKAQLRSCSYSLRRAFDKVCRRRRPKWRIPSSPTSSRVCKILTAGVTPRTNWLIIKPRLPRRVHGRHTRAMINSRDSPLARVIIEIGHCQLSLSLALSRRSLYPIEGKRRGTFARPVIFQRGCAFLYISSARTVGDTSLWHAECHTEFISYSPSTIQSVFPSPKCCNRWFRYKYNTTMRNILLKEPVYVVGTVTMIDVSACSAIARKLHKSYFSRMQNVGFRTEGNIVVKIAAKLYCNYLSVSYISYISGILLNVLFLQ